MLRRPPETSDNFHSKEGKRITSHECCQDADESGDLSPPRKLLARDDCDIITIGIKQFLYGLQPHYGVI